MEVHSPYIFMCFLRRSFSSLLVVLLLIPQTLLADRALTDIVDTTGSSVSRANFLSWSSEAFRLKKDFTCTLPYARVPRGLIGTLCAMQDKGALLKAFGDTENIRLNSAILRGEALIIITSLSNAKDAADIAQYKDVKTDDEKQAVMNAVSRKWMNSVSSSSFGLRRPLKGIEALSLLQAATAQLPQQVKIRLTPQAEQYQELPNEELLNAVWQLIQRDYLRSPSIDKQEAGYRAIEALVNSLGDPYTNFFRPATANEFQLQIKGELSGIGAHIEDRAGVITVVSPIAGSPAERAGIAPGDEILEADGIVLTGLGVDKAVTYIRGEVGTVVELKIRRAGTTLTVRVKRESISIPEISVSWQGTIAVINIAQFGEATLLQSRSVFSKIAAQNPTGIILDLRNNPGGLLTAANTVLSNFLSKGSITTQVKGRIENRSEKTSDTPIIPENVKMAVLVNKGSASASEIVAGALQDYKRATILGTQTFGKGTVQEVINFRTGEALKLTMAEWFTPFGRKIDGIGVKPDVIVEAGDRDPQLQRAIEILK